MSVVHGVDNSVLDALLNDLNAVDPTQFRWTMNASRQSVDFLDLTISKHRTFESTGRVETCSYKKPNCRSQMLAFASNHPTSCKLGIFRSETNRHLLNCSNPQDLYVKIAEDPPCNPHEKRLSFLSASNRHLWWRKAKLHVGAFAGTKQVRTSIDIVSRCHCFQMPIRYTY
jgi:hypothetical protein